MLFALLLLFALTFIANSEISRFVRGTDESSDLPVRLVACRAFNPNGEPMWLAALACFLAVLPTGLRGRGRRTAAC